MCLRSGIHEECGVFGVMAPNPCNVAGISYYGLYALQHRGQESCGIAVNADGVIKSHKDLGLVPEVFTPEVLAEADRWIRRCNEEERKRRQRFNVSSDRVSFSSFGGYAEISVKAGSPWKVAQMPFCSISC